MRRIGYVELSETGAGGTAAPAPADGEYWVLAIQRAGAGSLRQDGRAACLGPGDMAFYASARPHQLCCAAEARQTVLRFPAERLSALRPGIEALTATALDGAAPAARVLTLLADSYADGRFDAMPGAVQGHAANALSEAFAATLAACCADGGRPNLALFHLNRIKQYVAERLHDPQLSVPSVAQALHISPAHIHRLFEVERQTFSAWMWTRRLLASRLALENPAHGHLSVSQIAYSCGFNNSSHFSRVFRLKFGTTPSAWRKHAPAVPAMPRPQS